jgi:predicted transcriptional regulator
MDEREEARLGQFPIAGLLRQARRRCGMSQRDVARRARVSQATVARAESGTVAPTLDVFQRLLDVTAPRELREHHDYRSGRGTG